MIGLLGAALWVSPVVSEGFGDGVEDRPMVLAQASRCRDDEVYRPRNKRADRFGCVKRRFREQLESFDGGGADVLSGHGVITSRCDGNNVGGLCSGGYFTDVKFEQPFDAPPHVLVAVENVSSQGGCIGGATDKVVAYPENVTRHGFRLYAYGSPVGASCGDLSSLTSQATAGWIAVGSVADGGGGDGIPTPPRCLGLSRMLQWDGSNWLCIDRFGRDR